MFKFTSFPDTELKFANILEGVFVSGEACRELLPKTLFLSWVLTSTARSLMQVQQVSPAFLTRHRVACVLGGCWSLEGRLAAVRTPALLGLHGFH